METARWTTTSTPGAPRNPEEGFDDDAIDLAKRGRAITQKSMDTTPGQTHAEWRSFARFGRKNFGESARLAPLCREYHEAVESYTDRCGEVQTEVGNAYQSPIAA